MTDKNAILRKDLPIHGWYRFVLGYPPHLVRRYINAFDLGEEDLVLDPFCGTGTTPVECMMWDIPSIGIEPNPIVHLVTTVKTRWNLDPTHLTCTLGYIYHSTLRSLKEAHLAEGVRPLSSPARSKMTFVVGSRPPTLTPEEYGLIPTGFISPRPLKKVLILREVVRTVEDPAIRDFFLVALVNVLVGEVANIAFGPGIYATPPKKNCDVLFHYLAQCYQMIKDIKQYAGNPTPTTILRGDARQIDRVLGEELLGKVTAVITSPPYPNEKEYTIATRLESVILGFLSTKSDLRALKNTLLKSNSRTVFTGDTDGERVAGFEKIGDLADEIERQRVKLGKTSGFERAYHKVVRQYFGGMYRHLETLHPYLRKGAHLAYVVGDQNSYFRVHIPTARLLADIAAHLGYEVVRIDLWRRRFATALRKYIDENVLILKFTGD